MTLKEIEEILELVDRAAFDEFRVEIGDLKIHIVHRGSAAADRREEIPAARASALPPTQASLAPGAAPPAAPARSPTLAPDQGAEAEIPPGTVAARAPMVGTFYRAPSPGALPFVEVGTQVRKGDTLCLLEVMKLFNTITANVDGRVVAIPPADGSHVERDQILVLIEPSLN